jgi:hypothetical protein
MEIIVYVCTPATKHHSSGNIRFEMKNTGQVFSLKRELQEKPFNPDIS